MRQTIAKWDFRLKSFLMTFFKNNKNRELTSLLGTQIGVPSFTIPASMITPITIGSRELNIN